MITGTKFYGQPMLNIDASADVRFLCDYDDGSMSFVLWDENAPRSVMVLTGTADDLRGFARKVLDVLDEYNEGPAGEDQPAAQVAMFRRTGSAGAVRCETCETIIHPNDTWRHCRLVHDNAKPVVLR